MPDDKGNYTPIRIDPSYYPEVALDCVPTEAEYAEIKHLPKEEKIDIDFLNDSIEFLNSLASPYRSSSILKIPESEISLPITDGGSDLVNRSPSAYG